MSTHSHPFVGILFDEMEKRQLTASYVARVSGVSRATINEWKNRSNPNITNLEACLNAIGLEMRVIRK
jgi:transcriptional regulator with XRE-family HTH domain